MAEKLAWKFWKRAMVSRRMMNIASGNVKGWMVNTFVKDWSKNRSPIDFPKKSFNQLWKEKHKN